jgi:hypothetical protein
MIMLTAAIAAAMLMFGCGRDGGSSSNQAEAGGGGSFTGSATQAEKPSSGAEATSTADRAAFIQKASATCQASRGQGLQRITAYRRQHESEGLSSSVLLEKALKATLYETLEEEIDGIRKAAAATGYGPQTDTLVSELEATLDRAKANENLSPTEIEDQFAETDQALRKLGLTACSKS